MKYKAGEVIWEYKEGTEILWTYHKRDIDAVADPAAREAIVTYSYMLDDDLFGSTPTPEEDTSYDFNYSCAQLLVRRSRGDGDRTAGLLEVGGHVRN